MSLLPVASQRRIPVLAGSTHPLLAMLWLVPVVFVLAPLPIDETRYLAVAWEMRQSGQFLVPHLNGDWYSDKPPLLFWLINAGWLLTGVHAWTARALTLLCSVASLCLLQRLTWRLSGSRSAARLSVWLLLGMLYFATFADAIMFDVLLATCALLALHGVLDIETGRSRRGILIAGLAIGLGVLAKGPVMLLDVGLAALLAPCWSRRVRARPVPFFAAFGAALLLGVAIALAWAIPAALHGGDAYAHAILLHQTFDRVAASFAHKRPVWWYLMVLPLMLLPWPLVLRGRWSALRSLGGDTAVRFGLAWVVPTLIAFSLISGKQPHYLLPLLAGVALLLGMALDRGALVVRAGLFGLVLIALGTVLVVLPHVAQARPALAPVAGMWPLWGTVVAACGVVIVASRKHWSGPGLPASACVVVVMLANLALAQGPGRDLDPTPAAAQVHAAQARGQAIVHLGRHQGVYEFAGRLTEPLPVLPLDQFPAWAHQHPDGLVMSFDPRYRFRAPPQFSQPFRGGQIAIWRADEALASGIDPRKARAGYDPTWLEGG